jgi:hypothetical protein
MLILFIQKVLLRSWTNELLFSPDLLLLAKDIIVHIGMVVYAQLGIQSNGQSHVSLLISIIFTLISLV